MNLPYNLAMQLVRTGKIAERYGDCRKIRLADVADADYIPNIDLEGVIVEDCESRKCDCKTGIYRPTPEDIEANDWRIIN